jgi:acetyl esterase/lipase
MAASPSFSRFLAILSRLVLPCLGWAMAAVIAALGSNGAGAQETAPWGPKLFAPSREIGREFDAARAIFPSPFYRVPATEASAAPGKLVRAEPAKDFSLPPGVSAIRILYGTRTASNAEALASAVVLVPNGPPPANGWPLLAWAHGTSGVATECAPSLMKSLFYDWEGLYIYLTLGYAVVATDYTGLGTAGRHAYLDFHSNATDVIHAVPAAQAAVPALGRRWLAIGHSQGGLAVLGVAELEAGMKDPYFLGTVSLAGASDPADAIDNALNIGQPVLNGLIAFWVYGAQTLNPTVEMQRVLTPAALKLFETSVDHGCSEASGAFSALHTDDMLQPDWRQVPQIKAYLERNRPGLRPTRGPLLLLGGGDDVLFTEAASLKVAQRLCKAGGHLQRKVYPGLGHDPLVYGSLADQMRWIADRFAGKPAPDNCPELLRGTR